MPRFTQLLILGWLLLWAGLLWKGHAPLWTAAVLLAVNLLSLWLYAADKNAARSQGWRVPEKQLQLLSLLGGWPAAAWAQSHLRHKTSKTSFQFTFWAAVLIHCSASLALWLWPLSNIV